MLVIFFAVKSRSCLQAIAAFIAKNSRTFHKIPSHISLGTLLQNTCPKPNYAFLELELQNSRHSPLLVLHVDGRMRAEDADIFLQLLKSEPGSCASAGPLSGHVASSSWLSLPNNEHLNLPLNLRVIWEVEDLSCLSPSALGQLGVLAFGGNGELTSIGSFSGGVT